MDTVPLSRVQLQPVSMDPPLAINKTWNEQHQGPKTQVEMERVGGEDKAQENANEAGFIEVCCGACLAFC